MSRHIKDQPLDLASMRESAQHHIRDNDPYVPWPVVNPYHTIEILDELKKYQKTLLSTQRRMGEIRDFSETLEAVPDAKSQIVTMSADYTYDLGFAEGHNAALAALKKVLDS